MDARTVAERFHLLEPGDDTSFRVMAAAVGRFQREHNPVLAAWTASTYLPVDAFRHAPVCTFDPDAAEAVFLSSGTGSSVRSRHYVKDLDVYRRSVEHGFARVFGRGPFTLLAHLPGYETSGEESSLVCMARMLAERFGNEASGLFLDDVEFLERGVRHSMRSSEPILLLGAAFGLLDLVESCDAVSLPRGAIVVETGGMKTHRREISRDRLHERLASGFGIEQAAVRSEYGMCELMSQCYTRADGLFRPPPWMSVDIVEPDAPDTRCADGERGVVAVVDLANVYSASRLLTQDVGVRHGNGFRVLGRMSRAELRGCNFLLEDMS